MPAALKTRDEVVRLLAQVFRQHGYEGATLALMSQATGLVKASLYHYFPNGKQDMANAVLEYLGECSRREVLEPIAFDADPVQELHRLCERLTGYFQQGLAACILEVFSIGQARLLFQETIALRAKRIATSFARLLQNAGVTEGLALERGWEAIVVIEGALVVTRATANPTLFVQAMQKLPERLLR